MPNYCYSNIRFERINEDAKAKFLELQKRITEESNFSDLMQDGTIDEDEMFSISWQHEHVGPKWTHIEDYDDEGLSMNSAWGPPETGAMWLIEQLAEVDPNLITSFYYIEEQPDFVGNYIYVGTEMEDGYEDNFDDIKYVVEQAVEGLAEMVDEDGYYTEEGWELFHENVYEALDEVNSQFYNDAIQAIYDQEKENV